MTQQTQDVRLVITIENREPIELLDLTKSLVSLSTQFVSYVEKYGDCKENREAKLYVKEIKQGSVIFELFEFATAGMIPFLENTNTIIGFAQFFDKVVKYFLKNEGEDPDLRPSDMREYSTIVNPISKDNGSQMNISTTINGNVVNHFHINSTESNAFQNILTKEVEKLKLPEHTDEIHKEVLMTWFQARDDIRSKTGNKVLIDDLYKRPLNITFEDDELKETMLHSDLNPFNTVYVVDVKIQTVQDEPKAYKIMKLHNHFDRNEEEN